MYTDRQKEVIDWLDSISNGEPKHERINLLILEFLNEYPNYDGSYDSLSIKNWNSIYYMMQAYQSASISKEDDYERDEDGYLLSPCCAEKVNEDIMLCPKCKEHV